MDWRPERPIPGSSGLALPLAVLAAGVLWLGAVALTEALWLARQPWANAMLVSDSALDDPGAFAELEDARRVRIRAAERQEQQSEAIAIMERVITGSATETLFFAQEWVVAAPLIQEETAPLLAAGRLPEPGKPEVLAGPLAGHSPFTLDGTQFTVTGRLHGSIGGLVYAYLLPEHPAHTPLFGPGKAQTGWLHPDGVTALAKIQKAGAELVAGEAAEGEEGGGDGGTEPAVFEVQARTAAPFAWGTWLGLFVMAAGGTLFYRRLAVRLSGDMVSGFRPLFVEAARRPKLFVGVHIGLYALFFGFMAAGLLMPVRGYLMTRYMSSVFMEGGLSYIGQAYASGNILSAAGATFINNYFVQTVGLTYLASFLVPLAPGVLKTAASFALVGFAMAPGWTGTASGMTFHSVTMVLEMEGYILACFVVLLWPVCLLRAALRGEGWAAVRHGVRLMALGVVASGVILAFAALYEAATLIILRPLF